MWFKKRGFFYLPTSPAGYIIAVLFLAFCIHILVFFNSRVQSASDFLYAVFPYIVPAFLLYNWIAGEKK
jgi:hypothetical protein